MFYKWPKQDFISKTKFRKLITEPLLLKEFWILTYRRNCEKFTIGKVEKGIGGVESGNRPRGMYRETPR